MRLLRGGGAKHQSFSGPDVRRRNHEYPKIEYPKIRTEKDEEQELTMTTEETMTESFAALFEASIAEGDLGREGAVDGVRQAPLERSGIAQAGDARPERRRDGR